VRDLKVGGAIFHEGEEEDDSYIVTLRKGEIIGKTSLINDVPHSATAIAKKSFLLVLQRDRRLAQIEVTDSIMRLMIRMIVDQLRGVDALDLSGVGVRLAGRIYSVGGRTGHDLRDGTLGAENGPV
jgi:CRP-like cAMP-binding protein